MCGIAGIYDLTGRKIERQILEEMNSKMIFRGPDDEGYLFDKNFGMAMRRLSIIDCEGGKQPIYSEDGHYAVMLNGEIYNYLELRSQLIKRGHQFKTNSDTEVIVHLFEDKRENCVHDLNGMFSFALWDCKKREIYLFRDRLGIKPLYYSFQNSAFSFSSNLKSLRCFAQTDVIDDEAFFLYLMFSYIPSSHSIFKGIKKLPPGHYLKLNSEGKLEIKQYWDLNVLESFEGGEISKYKEELLRLLDESVSLQLRSDVPVGSFLSGGLDSSSVIASLARLGQDKVRTFSVGFEGGFNELPYAKEVSDKFGTIHSEIMFQAREVPLLMSELMPFLDEPCYDNSILPTFFLSKEVKKQGVKVILNGTGGDEVFGGYTRYQLNFQKKILTNTLPCLRRMVSLLFINDQNRSEKICHPEFMFLASGINLNFVRDVFLGGFDHEKKSLALSHIQKFVSKPNRICDFMYFDLKSYLPDDVLSLLDKMTMANSIEGRVPLLDHRLVEFAFKIPTHIKLRNGELKWFFRESIKNSLPPSLFQNPKRGFSGPTEYWMNHILKGSLEEHLIHNPIPYFRDHLNLEFLKKCVKGLQASQNYYGSIFGLYVFTLWYRNHCRQ